MDAAVNIETALSVDHFEQMLAVPEIGTLGSIVLGRVDLTASLGLSQEDVNDPRIDEMWPGYEQALKGAGVRYEMHMYPGTQHGFHNDSTPRYNEQAAKLAWDRTVAHFKKHLA